MTLGVSLLLVALGAILVWGIERDAEGINVDAIGVILMVIGLLGFLISMVFWSQWSPVYRGRRRYAEGEVGYGTRRAVYEEPPRRQVVVEEDDYVPPAGPPPP